MPQELNSTGAASRAAVATDELLVVGEGTGTAGADEVRRIIGGMGLFINTAYSGTSFNYALADAGRIAPASNAAAKVGTIPLNASVAFGVGAQFVAENSGAGILTVQVTSPATLNGVAGGSFTLANGEQALLHQVAVDVWKAFFYMNNNAQYRTLSEASGSHIAAKVAGTYAMGAGVLAKSGTGTLYPLTVIPIKAADYPAINGLTTKLRIRAQLFVNDVAPTGDFTFGLYPITRPGTSGGAGLNIYTLGTVVSGSNGATVSAPAADSANDLVGSDFAMPADGLYVLGVVTTATVATSSHLHLNAQLQMRNT